MDSLRQEEQWREQARSEQYVDRIKSRDKGDPEQQGDQSKGNGAGPEVLDK
jgi:hypothetical protein